MQRWLIARFLSDRPFVHTINVGPGAGLRFEVTLPLDNPIWTGVYEPQFTRTIVEQVRPGNICYDVGGYRGYISGVMAWHGQRKFLSSNLLPANQRAVSRLCELNPQLPINVIAVALGNLDGLGLLKVMPDTSIGKACQQLFPGGSRWRRRNTGRGPSD
jgi:hypothetical protein